MKPIIIIAISVGILFAIGLWFSMTPMSVERTVSNSVKETNSSSLEDKDWKKIVFPELYDDTGTRLPKYDETAWKVYVQNIPDYSHDSITTKTVTNALESWEELNSDLKFVQVSQRQESDIDIKWVTEINYRSPVIYQGDGKYITPDVMGITNTETTFFGEYETNHSEILIDLVDLDCNENPIFWDKETITNTIKHEIGHALGIVNHSSDENHLMYDPDDGIKNIITHGLVIPQKTTDGYYIGEKEILDEVERLDAQFVKNLGYYGFSESDWEYGRTIGDESFYGRINSIIDRLNPLIDESNCFIETTNKYDPYRE